MPYRSPAEQIEFEDRYGDKRVIRRTKEGLQVQRQALTPILAMSAEISRLSGARIKALRIARGLTLAELCTRAGIVSATPKSRMWEIENSERREGTSLGTIYALAMALDVEVCALLPPIEELRHIAAPVTAKQTAVALTNGTRP